LMCARWCLGRAAVEADGRADNTRPARNSPHQTIALCAAVRRRQSRRCSAPQYLAAAMTLGDLIQAAAAFVQVHNVAKSVSSLGRHQTTVAAKTYGPAQSFPIRRGT
jgi:hypothetical protein